MNFLSVHFPFSFENLADVSTALIRAHQKICLVPYSRPAFYDNLIDAYDLLRNQKGKDAYQGGMNYEITNITMHDHIL